MSADLRRTTTEASTSTNINVARGTKLRVRQCDYEECLTMTDGTARLGSMWNDTHDFELLSQTVRARYFLSVDQELDSK